jgi:ubiquinone/menaquinone biosynthesis C-methylase UbiE
MNLASDSGSADWDAHWPKVASWMQTNPAYKYRQKLIWRALALPAAPAPIKVLDVGCGDGSFLRSVSAFRSDATLAGLEGSSEGLTIARKALSAAALE